MPEPDREFGSMVEGLAVLESTATAPPTWLQVTRTASLLAVLAWLVATAVGASVGVDLVVVFLLVLILSMATDHTVKKVLSRRCKCFECGQEASEVTGIDHADTCPVPYEVDAARAWDYYRLVEDGVMGESEYMTTQVNQLGHLYQQEFGGADA